MRLRRLSPTEYRRVTLVALVLLVIIVVSGAAVRLTNSGLGCTDWPTCEQGHVVTALRYHGMIEFVNRVFTGLVSAVVVVAVLGSLVRTPRRRDLVWLSAGLVAGVIGQIVLGGIVVLTTLNPVAVQGHFIISMALVTNAVVLHRRAGGEPPYRLVVPPVVRRHAIGVAAAFAVAIATGTVVTGTGPHGGDEKAPRFSFAITSVARLHSGAVIVAVVVLLWLVYRLRRTGWWPALESEVGALLFIAVVQGTVGYAQYFSGVPAFLVLVHIIGALSVWIAALHLVLATTAGVQPTVDWVSDQTERRSTTA
ncbi:MAG: heme a synthase [Acidimicrobiaceae bacterium]|jgi:cytochrome c oxidase assembly protein subunit 15|nr:heme a synthase [Acidimicrobiaceae bacterium]